MVRDPRGPLRIAAWNVWWDLRRLRRAHSSRRSSVRARNGGEGHEGWLRLLGTKPVDLARRYDSMVERRGACAPRGPWRTGARRRHFPGRHRTPHVRGAVSASAENGNRRTARWRRSARLQQSLDRHSWILRAVASRYQARRFTTCRYRGNPEGGRPCGWPYASVAGFQPKTN